MKWIKYQILQSEVNGQVVLANKMVGYNSENIAIAQKEAYSGYEIVDDGQSFDKEPLAIELGGTHAKTVEDARKNLDVYGKEELHNHLSENIESYTHAERQYSHTGNPVVLDNYEGMPMNCVVSFKPIQEGSGNPYPAGTGKNKLPYPTVKSQTVNGIDYTFNADGTITANGTLADTTKTASITLHTTLFTVKAGSWKFICEGSKNINNFYPVLYQKGSTNVVVANARPNTYATFTTETDLENCYVFLACLNEYAPQNETLKIMLVSASETNLTYEPYSNIRPIVGYDNISVTRSGKNLMPEWEQGSIAQNGTDSDADKVIRSGWVAVVPNTVYTLTRTGTVGAFAVRCYDANKNYLGVGGVGTTTIGNYSNKDTNPLNTSRNEAVIKVLEGCYYLRFIDYANDLTNKYQLEVGETATAYEPYRGDAYSISLGQTVYGGILDAASGTLTVTHKLIVLKDRNWTESSKETGRFLLNIAVKPYVYPICDKLPGKVWNADNGGAGLWTLANNNGDQLIVRTDLSTLDEWKAWLAANDPRACYELETPETVQLSPAYIAALAGTNTLFTDGDSLTVTGRTDILYLANHLIERSEKLENRITYGTEDLVDGESFLPTGTVYLVYE